MARRGDNAVARSGQDLLATKKRRGPAPNGLGTSIYVRLRPQQLASLDAWISHQPDKLSRPEATRRLIERGLKGQ